MRCGSLLGLPQGTLYSPVPPTRCSGSRRRRVELSAPFSLLLVASLSFVSPSTTTSSQLGCALLLGLLDYTSALFARTPVMSRRLVIAGESYNSHLAGVQANLIPYRTRQLHTPTNPSLDRSTTTQEPRAQSCSRSRFVWLFHHAIEQEAPSMDNNNHGTTPFRPPPTAGITLLPAVSSLRAPFPLLSPSPS